MANKSITKRIKITKTGKIKRRAMTLGHSRANKSRVQMKRKKRMRGLNISTRTIRRYL